MKTPTEWINKFAAHFETEGYHLYIAESDIKAIQDEAFKAGMTRAAMEVARWTGTELANDILRMREKLP